MTPSQGIEPEPYWWEVSALTTEPPLPACMPVKGINKLALSFLSDIFIERILILISVTLTINWSYQNRERTSKNAAFSTVEIFSGTEKARAASSKVSINCFSHRTPTRQTDQIQKLVNRVCQLPISFFLFSGFLTVSK